MCMYITTKCFHFLYCQVMTKYINLTFYLKLCFSKIKDASLLLGIHDVQKMLERRTLKKAIMKKP